MRKTAHKSKQIIKGFTLVELLVTIAIIVILATVGLVVFSNTSSSARDAKRKADLRAITLAVEQYKASNGTYPCFASCGWSFASNLLGVTPTYMQQIPNDPTNGASCPGYLFALPSSALQYTLFIRLENPNDPFVTKAKSPPVQNWGTTSDGYQTYTISSGTCTGTSYNFWQNNQL